MTENLPVINADQHLIREMIDRTIQEADPEDKTYSHYRQYSLTRLIPEADLPSALAEVRSLIKKVQKLRFTVERKRDEDIIQYVVEKINNGLPGEPEEHVNVSDFMQMRFLRDIGMILNRLPQNQFKQVFPIPCST